jgi:hypothetical protein
VRTVGFASLSRAAGLGLKPRSGPRPGVLATAQHDWIVTCCTADYILDGNQRTRPVPIAG